MGCGTSSRFDRAPRPCSSSIRSSRLAQYIRTEASVCRWRHLSVHPRLGKARLSTWLYRIPCLAPFVFLTTLLSPTNLMDLYFDERRHCRCVRLQTCFIGSPLLPLTVDCVGPSVYVVTRVYLCIWPHVFLELGSPSCLCRRQHWPAFALAQLHNNR